VIDAATLRSWIEALGYEATPEGSSTLRLHPRPAAGGAPAAGSGAEAFPPFFLQLSDNWVLLSMLPMLGPGSFRPDDLSRRLLAANRDMRLAKFALDKEGAVVLCAELPTESLDASEVADAVQRMVQYARRFAAEFVRRK